MVIRFGRIIPVLACALAMLLLSSCAGADAGLEGLMLPPKLTSEQSELYSALETAAGTENLRLRYPKSGEGSSAFIFRDIDADGADEAIVFYSTQDSSATRINILRKTAEKWVSVYDMKGNDTSVVSVDFAQAQTGLRIVIGWSSAISGQKTLTLCRFADNMLSEELTMPYQASAICDMTGDDYEEVVVFGAADDNGDTSVSLLSLDGEQPRVTSETKLAFGAEDYLAITPGKMSGFRALYVDYSVGGGVYSSDVIYFTGDGLKSYFSEYDVLPLRYEEIVTEDVTGNGVPDIPVQRAMTDSGDEDAVCMTEYIELNGKSSVTVMTAVINLRDGYLFELPADWIDSVELRKSGDSGEWCFFEKNGNSFTEVELLRIKTVNKNTYHDKFDESYKLIADRGVNQYYMFVPVSESPMQLSLTECKNRFRLLG